jgi:hypothetical protein
VQRKYKPLTHASFPRYRVPASIVVVECESYFESDLIMCHFAVFDMAARL